MRMLRVATVVALGLAALGAKAAAPDAGAGQAMTAETQKQSTIASRLALRHQQASAMADLAIERSQNPEVVAYARQAKQAHERSLAALIEWADEQKAELAAVTLAVPRQGTGGSGLTEQEQKKLDEQLKRADPQLRGEAKRAQAELSGLANAAPAEFDQRFLASMEELQEAQVETAKAARDEFSEDADFSALMSATETALATLGETVKALENQLEQ